MIQTLNSPLEVGVRIVTILASLYPRPADLARLVLLDHVVLHSGDFGGSPSLHPPTSIRSGEMGMKRELISQALHLMGSRALVTREFAPEGIHYIASDDALPFLQTFDSSYLVALRLRANWAAATFGGAADEDIRGHLKLVFGQWAEEFDTDIGDKANG